MHQDRRLGPRRIRLGRITALSTGACPSAATSTTAPRTTALGAPAATSRPMPATRPNTARCAATSPSAVGTSRRRRHGVEQVQCQPRLHPVGGLHVRSARSRSIDFYSVPATSYWGAFPASDTGDPGWKVIGYTAQFGNGFSATIAAEMRRKLPIVNVSGICSLHRRWYFPDRTPALIGGFQAPDIVANLRVDQAWGSARSWAPCMRSMPLL